MRRFLAIIGFLLLAVQLLPVKSIGELLSKNVITEEVTQSNAPNEVIEDHFAKSNYLEPNCLFGNAVSATCRIGSLTRHSLFIHNSILPDSYKGDVFAPPPNC